MENNKKKQIAAITAVIEYLQAEQAQAPAIEIQPPNIPTSWAFYGRQNQMINNQMMQRRVIKR
ncbi:MAG: hypothetical protein P9L91_08805 [Candidatus Zophobacter franzmannii]|jgi:hypothetical protein|nr:hypothetical protein [Candidatus Zophobacter franzmannii]